MKNKIGQLLVYNLSMGMIVMDTENNKTSKPYKSVLSLTQGLDLRSSNKHVAI